MAGVELFGFEIKRKPTDAVEVPSFTPPETDDGALTVSAGGAYGTYLDLEGSARTEAEIVAKYREMAIQPEMETAIDEIVNEAIVIEDSGNSIEINLDAVKAPPQIKKKIEEEFNLIKTYLNFYDDLPHIYNSGRNNYRDYYYSKTRKIVEDLAIEDIQQFGYQY